MPLLQDSLPRSFSFPFSLTRSVFLGDSSLGTYAGDTGRPLRPRGHQETRVLKYRAKSAEIRSKRSETRYQTSLSRTLRGARFDDVGSLFSGRVKTHRDGGNFIATLSRNNLPEEVPAKMLSHKNERFHLMSERMSPRARREWAGLQQLQSR